MSVVEAGGTASLDFLGGALALVALLALEIASLSAEFASFAVEVVASGVMGEPLFSAR